MRETIAMDPFMRTCARSDIFGDHECVADPLTHRLIEWEHAFIHAGKQINEPWAIVPSCWWAHRGPGLEKEKNQLIALLRATPADLEKYPRGDWQQKYQYLSGKYYNETHVYDWPHGPGSTCVIEECWMCAVIDEML